MQLIDLRRLVGPYAAELATMRSAWLTFVLTTVVVVTCSRQLEAGLYISTEAPAGPAALPHPAPIPFRAFREQLQGLIALLNPLQENPLKAHYRDRVRTLEGAIRSGQGTVQDLSDLGGYYIRLGQYLEAVDVLTRAVATNRGHYFALANLATAHQLEGQPARALEYLIQARAMWPPHWPGFSDSQWGWFAKVDRLQEHLLRLRLRQGVNASSQNESTLDLFPVRFVGSSGRYEAGKLAEAERVKLPGDALALVEQLLITLPSDAPLYWLFGELLNAQGDVQSAFEVMDECLWARRYDAPVLREHRNLLAEFQARAAAVPLAEPASPVEPPARWRFHKPTLIAVGVGAVLLITVLSYFQVRELRMRRRTARSRRRDFR